MLTGELAEEAKRAGLRRVRLGYPMSRYTSWRTGGRAEILGVADDVATLRAVVKLGRRAGVPCLVLGGGSNVLVSDAGVDGIVILNRIGDTSISSIDGETAVEAGSGAFFAKVARFSARQGYTGLEWGVAIPGTVGAGVVNNAGAHHGDVQRSLIRTEVVSEDGASAILQPKDLAYRYRGSELKPEQASITRSPIVVTRAWFRIRGDAEGSALRRIRELTRIREATQPIAEPSGGSTFKNPEGTSAGAVIERAGLKGRRLGGAAVSTKHANFIVNLDNACSADILALIRLAQVEVWRQLQIRLEPEIQLVGRWTEQEAASIWSGEGAA